MIMFVIVQQGFETAVDMFVCLLVLFVWQLNVKKIQAALPQGIVPFVFAKEYNVHPDILSTA